MKKILTYAGIVLSLLAVAYAFVPQVFSGKVVNQSDISSWMGMTHEINEWNHNHPDDKALWTGSMFGGMPTVAMYDDFDGDWTKPLYKLLMTGKRPANWLFVALLGGFLLMLSLGIDKFLAAVGAISLAFCSYNMQIIQVGHNTKMQAIALMPWVLASLVMTYKAILKDGKMKELLPKAALGSVLFALALSFQIKANHPQISYYLAIIVFLYALCLLIWIIAKKKEFFAKFALASALLLFIGGVGIATNTNKLIPTWKYTKYTMRGGSELAAQGAVGNSKGLDLEYATAWSYGIEETPNLLIPNFNGGASAGGLKKDSETGKLLSSAGYKGKNLTDTLNSLPLYWGPQPFTAGPMYMGCISIFLFVLGLFLYKGKEKWWLLAATLIAVFLSWGNHMMWFTKLWFEYAPLYSKFRTVSMALVVLQVTLPMLGFMVLDKIMKAGYSFGEFKKALWPALIITGGFCLIAAVFPGIAGNFKSSVDSQLPEALADSLADDRKAMLSRDALHSLVFILIAALTLLWGYKAMGSKNNPGKTFDSSRTIMATAVICALVILDLVPAGKRYLNQSHFMTKKNFEGQFEPRPVDSMILEDNDPDYRVLDISVNTFNDSYSAYHHKCIGGYSPVKLQRYQDLIDRQLKTEINSVIASANSAGTIENLQNSMPATPVLNALNCKYVIIGGDYPPVTNVNAFGNAWFVDGAVKAEKTQDEIEMLSDVNLKKEAVIGNDFFPNVAPFSPEMESDYIKLETYSPNKMVYSYKANGSRLAVFSEVFYPDGWEMSVNGEKVDLLRADWILRAAVLPEGSGEIQMTFRPASYRIGERISRASSITLLILLLLSAGFSLTKVYLPKK